MPLQHRVNLFVTYHSDYLMKCNIICLVYHSEATEVAVEAFNKESALHVLLQIASAFHVPLSLRTLAGWQLIYVLPDKCMCMCLLSVAQCLQTITEDNPDAIQSIATSSDLLTLLEGALTSCSHSSDSTQVALVRVTLAGKGAKATQNLYTVSILAKYCKVSNCHTGIYFVCEILDPAVN